MTWVTAGVEEQHFLAVPLSAGGRRSRNNVESFEFPSGGRSEWLMGEHADCV